MGFETLMIEEKEKEGVGDLVRPKFVPTLHIGLKIGKVQNIDTSSTCFTFFMYNPLKDIHDETHDFFQTSPNIALFWIFLEHCTTHHLVFRSLPLAITLHHLKQL